MSPPLPEQTAFSTSNVKLSQESASEVGSESVGSEDWRKAVEGKTVIAYPFNHQGADVPPPTSTREIKSTAD